MFGKLKASENYQENDIHTHQISPKGNKLAKDPLVRSTLEQTRKNNSEHESRGNFFQIYSSTKAQTCSPGTVEETVDID